MTAHSRIILAFIVLVTLSSCSSMRFDDFFSGYVEQMKPAINAQLQGDIDKALLLIPKQSQGHNSYTLSLLEMARLSFLQEDWSTSKKMFGLAYKEVRKEKLKAKIQISKGLQHVGALVSNDNAIKYQLPAYELSMMHSYQALNYLYQGSLQSALVEIRRANLVQENALLANENKLYEAQEEMINSGVGLAELTAAYPSMNEMIGEVKNGFQNAYTFYLSAVLYEAAGQENDAYVDYKKALEIFPDNQYVQQDVLRLANKLQMSDDIAYFNQQFSIDELSSTQQESNDLEESEGREKHTGQLVIFYEQNLVNAKQSAAVNLPIGTRHNDLRFFSFALPVYRAYREINQPLYITVNEQQYESSSIVTLQSLASKQLTDQLPSIVARQALRLIAKEQVRRQLSKQGGDIGNIFATIYNMASEKADTRSWLSLPNNIQVMKITLPTGQHWIKAEHSNGISRIDVDIETDKLTMINLSTFGNYVGYQSLNL